MSTNAAQLLIENAKLKAELDRLQAAKLAKKSFGLLFYRPHKKQDMFHRAGDYPFRYVRTGNRFGKSTMGAAEDCAWALGYRPWYPEGDPARYVGIPKRSVKGLIVVADWNKAEEIFTNQVDGQARGKLFQLLPEDKLVDTVSKQGNIVSVLVKSKWGGVSSINLTTIKSYKSNPMGQESSDWDFIHVDEPCPEGMWKANSRGLVDREGSAWFTCTPITEPWINDMFCPSGMFNVELDGAHVEEKQVEGMDERVVYWMITGSMHDNPHNSEKAKANFIAGLKQEEIETRIDGRPSNLTGVVYPEFKRDVHIYSAAPKGWRDAFTPPSTYTLRIAIDTHPSTPHAVLFAATAPTGHVFFFSEIFEKIYIPQLCDQIWERLNNRLPLRALLEQAAYNESPFENVKTLAEEFMNHERPLPVERAVKDPYYGIMRVKHQLTRRDKAGNPMMLFHESLRETLREFDRYIWDPNKVGKVVDKDDHMMENLYRLVLTGLEWIDPADYELAFEDHSGVTTRLPRVDLSLPQIVKPEVVFERYRR